MKTVVFLQNAWSPVYAGREWPRRSWLLALAKSRSGKRLRVMIDDLTCCWNTTPICGATAGSVVPADLTYIGLVLWRERPELVVACGLQAQLAADQTWPGSLLLVPHPAHRLVTDELYRTARLLITGWPDGCRRCRLWQAKGGVEADTCWEPSRIPRSSPIQLDFSNTRKRG